MEISVCESKFCDKMGVRTSTHPDMKSKDLEIPTNETCRQIEETFGVSSLMNLGSGDGITEMIYGIGLSIKYDEVLDELKEVFAERQRLTVENNGSFYLVNDTSPDNGAIHSTELNSSTRKEVTESSCAKAESTESKEITNMLQYVAKYKISQSYEEVRKSLSEASQKIAVECSEELREELAQYSYADLVMDYDKLLSYTIESFQKAALGFGNGLAKRLVVGFGRIVQKFGDGLVEELVSWYDDGLIEDVSELNSEFDEEMEDLTKDAIQKLISVCDKEIKGYSFNFRKEIVSDIEEVHKRFTTTEDLEKETNLDFDDAHAKLEEARRDQDTSALQGETPAITKRKDRFKHPFGKMWRGIKTISCCSQVAEGNE